MLIELAAANAAYAVIKETITNGNDIMAAGASVFTFFNNKTELAKKANSSGSDSEAFFALETIKQNEQQLKELMIYTGRAGLWDDWLAFQVEARKKREAEAREALLKKNKQIQLIKDVINISLATILVCTGLFAVVGLGWAIITKGQF